MIELSAPIQIDEMQRSEVFIVRFHCFGALRIKLSAKELLWITIVFMVRHGIEHGVNVIYRSVDTLFVTIFQIQIVSVQVESIQNVIRHMVMAHDLVGDHSANSQLHQGVRVRAALVRRKENARRIQHEQIRRHSEIRQVPSH